MICLYIFNDILWRLRWVVLAWGIVGKCRQFWRVRIKKSRLLCACRLGSSLSGIPPLAVLGFLILCQYQAMWLLPRNREFTWWNKSNAINGLVLVVTQYQSSHHLVLQKSQAWSYSTKLEVLRSHAPPWSEGDRTLEDHVGWNSLAWSSLEDRIDYKPLESKA